MVSGVLNKIVLCVMGLFAGLSFAAPLEISGVVNSGAYMQAGVRTGYFDGSSVLPSRYRVESASLEFSFFDDAFIFGDSAQTSQTSSVDSGQYALVSSVLNDRYYDNGYYRNIVTTTSRRVITDGEGVQISLENQFFGQGSTDPSLIYNDTGLVSNGTEFADYTSTSWVLRCNPNCVFTPGTRNTYFDRYFTRTITETTDSTGDFSISGQLSDNLIDIFEQDNFLNFSFLVSGDLFLQNARLILEVTNLDDAGNEVPEPSTVLLFLVGCLGIFLHVKRSNQRQYA